ncbi:hypothetical protein BN3661_02205 [Eubacteriaceae bacterium CHKCI005]|nr:hypothetical protein BN3661_02205 [Eubacteriaceae bacterium CHKCI005]
MMYRSPAVQSAIYQARLYIMANGWPDNAPNWRHYRQLIRMYYVRANLSQYMRRTYGR